MTDKPDQPGQGPAGGDEAFALPPGFNEPAGAVQSGAEAEVFDFPPEPEQIWPPPDGHAELPEGAEPHWRADTESLDTALEELHELSHGESDQVEVDDAALAADAAAELDAPIPDPEPDPELFIGTEPDAPVDLFAEPQESDSPVDLVAEPQETDTPVDLIVESPQAPDTPIDLVAAPLQAPLADTEFKEEDSATEPVHPRRERGTATAKGKVRASSEAEIAQLWSNVFFSAEHQSPEAVVVTSARPGDGASQIAASLAIVGAEANDDLRIALVDFNLRKRGLARALRLKESPGATEVLAGKTELDDAIQAISLPNGNQLSVLTSGPKADHPLSLIKSRQLRSLIGELRKQFDHVIFDVPSAGAFPDAQVVGSMVDGALLVVNSGSTPRETVSEAKKRLDLAQVRCLGIVLNQRSDPVPGILYRMT